MRRRITGFMAVAALAVLLPGCDQTANQNVANRNANVNANANAATPTPSVASNSNRAPTRAEYESNKERYSREEVEATVATTGVSMELALWQNCAG